MVHLKMNPGKRRDSFWDHHFHVPAVGFGVCNSSENKHGIWKSSLWKNHHLPKAPFFRFHVVFFLGWLPSSELKKAMEIILSDRIHTFRTSPFSSQLYFSTEMWVTSEWKQQQPQPPTPHCCFHLSWNSAKKASKMEWLVGWRILNSLEFDG